MIIGYLSLFISWVDSFSSLIIFFIHNNIISYPNAQMDNRFFKSWVLHITHCLKDILWIMRAWSSVAPIFSPLIMSRAYSCVLSSKIPLKVITSFWHTFLERMNPMILGFHSRWLSPLLHSPLLLLPLQVVLHYGSSHSSTIFSKPSSDLSSYIQIAWSRNKTSLVSLGRNLWYKLIHDWISNDLLGLDQVILV